MDDSHKPTSKIPPGWTDDESYIPETEPPQASKPLSDDELQAKADADRHDWITDSAYDALKADHDEICQAYLNKLSDYSDLYAELMAERNTLARSASEWSRRSIELKAEAEKLAEALSEHHRIWSDNGICLSECSLTCLALTNWRRYLEQDKGEK